jgi:hypothetical protein
MKIGILQLNFKVGDFEGNANKILRGYDTAVEKGAALVIASELALSGGIVLSTGNKSELSVGYCTLYGDMVGGFAVLSDVYKTKVYELAHCIIEKGGRCLTPRPPF